MIFTDALPRVWALIWGFHRFWAPGLVQTAGSNCLELEVVMSALHHWAPVLLGRQVMIAQQAGRDSFPFPVTSNSGAIPVASVPGQLSGPGTFRAPSM